MIHPISQTNFTYKDVELATKFLKNGDVIVYPTDTLYGLGCDIFKKDAVNKIYKIKKLPKRKPLSIICSDFKQLSQFATISNSAFRTMKEILPGPFTCILKATNKVPKLLISKQRTVGIRIPDSPFIKAVIENLGNPIISTSLTNAHDHYLSDSTEIYHQYKHQIDILFASESSSKLPSTVIDLTGYNPKLIREGLGNF